MSTVGWLLTAWLILNVAFVAFRLLVTSWPRETRTLGRRYR